MHTFAVVAVLYFALLVSSDPLYADTITIVNGPNTPPLPANNIVNDDYIQAQLGAGNVLLNTDNSSGGGPDDIRIEAGVEINWNTEFSLTLIADQHIVVTGTLQHDGPSDGVVV